MSFEMGKLYALHFPDGTVMPGFRWSAVGGLHRRFPDSGIHSGQINSLFFTPAALADADILAELEEDATTKFAAVGTGIMRGADCFGTARSASFARRIANALNSHKINRRGT